MNRNSSEMDHHFRFKLVDIDLQCTFWSMLSEMGGQGEQSFWMMHNLHNEKWGICQALQKA